MSKDPALEALRALYDWVQAGRFAAFCQLCQVRTGITVGAEQRAEAVRVMSQAAAALAGKVPLEGAERTKQEIVDTVLRWRDARNMLEQRALDGEASYVEHMRPIFECADDLHALADRLAEEMKPVG